jgi:hypothetical protein
MVHIGYPSIWREIVSILERFLIGQGLNALIPPRRRRLGGQVPTLPYHFRHQLNPDWPGAGMPRLTKEKQLAAGSHDFNCR